MQARLVAALVVLAVPALAARAPCPGGRFVVGAARPLLAADAGGAEVVTIADGRVGIGTACAPVAAAVTVRGGVTRLRARFPSCHALLKATLTADCAHLRGVLVTPRARPTRHPLRAVPVPFPQDVPLDPTAPWPKFRRDVRQTGRSPVVAVD